MNFEQFLDTKKVITDKDIMSNWLRMFNDSISMEDLPRIVEQTDALYVYGDDDCYASKRNTRFSGDKCYHVTIGNMFYDFEELRFAEDTLFMYWLHECA